MINLNLQQAIIEGSSSLVDRPQTRASGTEMRAAAVPPLCCVAQPDAEDGLFRQRWCRRLPCSAIGRVLPEARSLVQCNVASSPGSTGSESGKIEQHHLGECVPKIPTISTTCSIREARIEEFWQVADTHCSSFMPDQGLLMDFALRFDRVMALVGSLPLHKKKCLVAVEEEPYVEHEEFIMASLFSNLITSHLVSGVLTIDNIGEYLPRRRPSGRRRTGIAYVSNVAVQQTKRRKGIAKKLLKASEQLAKSWGCRSIALHCDVNNAGAVSLYTGQGYKVVKVPMAANWPQPKGLQGSNFVLMMKSLASL